MVRLPVKVVLVAALAMLGSVPSASTALAGPGGGGPSVDVYLGPTPGAPALPPRFEGVDPTPATDLDAIDTPPASLVLAKESQAADYEVQVSQYLVMNAGVDTPDDSWQGAQTESAACPDGEQCRSGGVPDKYALPIVGVKQQQATWCVPATVSMILGAMDKWSPNQINLAREMRTTRKGTSLGYVAKPLNKYQDRNRYQWIKAVRSAQDLLARAAVDIYRYRSTYLVAIDVATIGYYPSGWSGSHAVNNYAYYTQSGGGLWLLDPMNPEYSGGQSYFGKHKVTLATAYASNKVNGSGIVW